MKESSSLTLLGGTSSIASSVAALLGGTSSAAPSRPAGRVSTAVATDASRAVGALSLVFVLAFPDSIFSQALDRFLSLGLTHVAWGRGVNLRTEGGRGTHT